jgi:hypothetical protein
MAADHGKAFERRHARRFMGGKRIVRPDFGVEMPDGESGSDVWECRDRKAITVVTWFEDRRVQYAEYTGDRRFHLAFHIPGRKKDYVMSYADDYAYLVRCEGKLNLLTELGYKDLEWSYNA